MASHDIAVAVLENPLLDITVQDDDWAIHQKYKLEHGQASLVDEHTMPIHDELFAREDKELTVGGSALNTARACNFLLHKAGHPQKVMFSGCIAHDEAGEILKKSLNDADMIGTWAFTEETGTGRCAVVVHGKERTLCANIGASAKYPTSAYDENEHLFRKAGVIYTTGFFITSNAEAFSKCLTMASSENIPVCFNISAVFVCQFYKDTVDFAIEHADFVFCNEDEASQYAEMNGLDKTDRLGAAKFIAKYKKANSKRNRVSIITQGADCVIIAEANPNTPDAEPWTMQVNVRPIPKENIIDTNGAGDSFVGGFLSAYVQKKHIVDCVKAGIDMSAIVVQRLGCQFE
jgi:adenosine kinase